jgi:hypothetical protein
MKKKGTKQKQRQTQKQNVIQNVIVKLANPKRKRRKGRKKGEAEQQPQPIYPSFTAPIVYQQVVPPSFAPQEIPQAFKQEVKRSILEEMGLKFPRPMTAEQKKEETVKREESKIINETFPAPNVSQTPLESDVYKPSEIQQGVKRSRVEEPFATVVSGETAYPLIENLEALTTAYKGDVEVPAKKLGAPPRKSRWSSTDNLNRIYKIITGKNPPVNTKNDNLIKEIYYSINRDASPSDDQKTIRTYVSDYVKDKKNKSILGL